MIVGPNFANVLIVFVILCLQQLGFLINKLYTFIYLFINFSEDELHALK